MITSSNEFKISTKCMGITQNQATVAYRKVMNYCMNKYANNDENIDIQNKCVETGIDKEFNITPEIIKKCTPDDENNLDEITTQPGQNLSEKELAAQEKSGLEQMQAMADMIKQQSAGTENSITLPIYPNAQLMANHQHMKLSGKKTLPVAMLSSNDDIKKIVNYYRKELPQFKMRFKMNVYEFAEKLPSEKLDFNSYNEAFYFIPSITIYQATKATPVTIQLVYQK